MLENFSVRWSLDPDRTHPWSTIPGGQFSAVFYTQHALDTRTVKVFDNIYNKKTYVDEAFKKSLNYAPAHRILYADIMIKIGTYLGTGKPMYRVLERRKNKCRIASNKPVVKRKTNPPKNISTNTASLF